MTFLLVITLGLLFVYALYFAVQTARIRSNPGDFLDGGMTLPGWSVMFILPAIGVAALGFERHLLLVSRYGLQASHVAVGLITVAGDSTITSLSDPICCTMTWSLQIDQLFLLLMSNGSVYI